jgi:hypothetical protein
MEVDRKPVIYANGEDPFQMDISDNAHNNNDPNNSFLRTNTPLPQPSSFQEPEYDSEDEYVNYMASLNISDEFNVSIPSTAASILEFTLFPVETSTSQQQGRRPFPKCRRRNRAVTPARTASLASQVLRRTLSSYSYRS